uniref:Replication protein A C-terminal domain-containing protein n=1 Tax=Dendroctonus ponderosae TaxID=77166 RepID=J3JWX4_DENPD|nr:unknown [Dendroctonus ponderosae]
MWNTGYNSGFNDSTAGGFLNNTTNDSPSVKQPKSVRRLQSVVPLVVRMLRDSGDEFKLFGMPVQIVSLVGILLEFDVQSTKASYTIQDHTGSIKAIFWLEGENCDEACKMPAVKEGGYVKVYGTIRNQEGEKALMVLKMFPIDDCNIILTHLLEVIDTRLQAEVMSKNTAQQIKQNNPGATLANSMTMFDENVVENGQHNLSGIQLRVYKFLQSDQSQAGPDIASILGHFPPNQRKDANEALDFLVNEGHAYSTIDNEHFKPTDV